MATLVQKTRTFQVVHPLYDAPEEKHSPESLGRMHMTKSVKGSLIALRVYLFLMVGLAVYRMISLMITTVHIH